MRPRLGLLCLAAVTLAAQTRVEDSDPAVIKNGNWETVTDPAASGGTFLRTTNAAAGASLTLRFTGDTIRIFRQVLNSGGRASITIDGRPWGTLRFDFAETRMGAPVVIESLGAGPHTLVMTVDPSRPIFTQQDPVSISFDAFETPVAFTPTAEQTAALARYNQIRAAAGYPAARLSIPRGEKGNKVSIHAAREGSDCWGMVPREYTGVSIHAAREGSDQIRLGRNRHRRRFNPRCP